MVFDLLRFEDGSFSFDEGDVTDAGLAGRHRDHHRAGRGPGPRVGEVETVVPSMHAWLSLVAEIEDDTHVTPEPVAGARRRRPVAAPS